MTEEHESVETPHVALRGSRGLAFIINLVIAFTALCKIVLASYQTITVKMAEMISKVTHISPMARSAIEKLAAKVSRGHSLIASDRNA